MADEYFLCVIEEMDRLWFHQIILFSQPLEKKPVPDPISSESVSCPSSMLSLLPYDKTSMDESPSPEKQVSSESISGALQDGSINNNEEKEERLAKVDILCNRIRWHSSSPSSSQHSQRKFRKTCAAAATRKVLLKSMSCRTMGELELDEVKGFMDLGFIFKKETLSPRMMSVVPGLQRLGLHQNKHSTQQMNATTQEDEDGDRDREAEEEQKKRAITRPYLSEAWLIKRPDSPLLSLKVPKACTATNMKKHLRFWAKTVASEIHQQRRL